MEPPPPPGALERLLAAHAELKRRIHGFRVPIESKYGRRAMGLFYFTVPVVAGYWVMQWSNGVRERNLGSDRQRLLDAKQAWGERERPTVVMARTPVPRAPAAEHTTTRVL